MTNSNLVLLAQQMPGLLVKARTVVRRLFSATRVPGIPLFENIDHFPSVAPKTRHALISLVPEAWLSAVRQYPDIRLFNYYGLTYEMVRALNENGYVVDIADLNREHVPARPYDLFVGHGGKCRMILDHLPPATPVLQYVSGVHWKTFNEESAARYRSFSERKNAVLPDVFRRSFDDQIQGEEYLTSKADALFTIHCPRMISSYGGLAGKFFYTGLGAYPDPKLIPGAGHDLAAGGSNFIYVGGTGGNIQKGLDVLIDAFAKHPDLHLYIYCMVEPELMRYSARELNLPNIHYIYHWRAPIYRKKLAELLRVVNFTVHAPINAGLGTAFMASLGAGLIPVGYLDYCGPPDSAVVADSWQVDALAECIRAASGKSVEWCAGAVAGVRGFYEAHCTSGGFHQRFSELVRTHTAG